VPEEDGDAPAHPEARADAAAGCQLGASGLAGRILTALDRDGLLPTVEAGRAAPVYRLSSRTVMFEIAALLNPPAGGRAVSVPGIAGLQARLPP
jgi:hypothetical protein